MGLLPACVFKRAQFFVCIHCFTARKRIKALYFLNRELFATRFVRCIKREQPQRPLGRPSRPLSLLASGCSSCGVRCSTSSVSSLAAMTRKTPHGLAVRPRGVFDPIFITRAHNRGRLSGSPLQTAENPVEHVVDFFPVFLHKLAGPFQEAVNPF